MPQSSSSWGDAAIQLDLAVFASHRCGGRLIDRQDLFLSLPLPVRERTYTQKKQAPGGARTYEGILRRGGRRQAAAAAAVQALLGCDGGLLQALPMLPGLLPGSARAAQGRLRALLLLLVVLRDALLQIKTCSWHSST